ncbi:MAG TPA: hypothetical protein VFS60_09940 [Thermoanaerobaculia bacterium]|nr:hypothetical protein [Thermoanaerobaculia bacterium]
MERALAGDKLALTRLVAALTPVVQARAARTLLCRCGRAARHEVEDRAQEVFLLLFANQGYVLRSWRVDGGLSLENFVGLVTKRHVLSFLRSNRRNPWKEEPRSGDLPDMPDDDGGRQYRKAAARQELEMLLDRLHDNTSPLGFHLFELLFLRELSLDETMAETGLSADAVYAWRSRLRQLARKLRSEMSGTATSARTPREEHRG